MNGSLMGGSPDGTKPTTFIPACFQQLAGERRWGCGEEGGEEVGR